MYKPSRDRVCQLCSGPVSSRNTTGFCIQNAACRKAGRRVHFDRWYPDHKGQASAAWGTWYADNKDQRAEYKREYRQDPINKERERAYVQEFKTRPENAERVREYNRRGRQRYMARADRPCLSPDGCDQFARVGSKWCLEHQRIEAGRHRIRSEARRREALAERQEWLCPWCSDYLPPALGRTHIDHIIPRCSGLVIEEEWNYQLLHGRCNQEKAGKITPPAIALAIEHGLVLAA